MRMNGPETANFPIEELCCKCRKCDAENGVKRHALLALQMIRNELAVLMPDDCAMPLTSAYRCPMHPIEAAKEKPGTHGQGIAFDIAVPWGRKRMLIVELALKYGFKGFGYADDFLHIDFRDSEQVVSWGY